MSSLNSIDMLLVDDMFERENERGYVLDFSNRTFSQFFAGELKVDIDVPIYQARGTSKMNRLRCYLQTVDNAAAAQALKALWEYREAIRQRARHEEKVQNARVRLFDLIRRLEGEKSAAATVRRRDRVDATLLEQLKKDLIALSALEPQPRGYAFEKLLKTLFDAFGMEAREPFRLRGEQIDGSFVLAEVPYLVEAKWQNAQTAAADLRAFNGKVEDKAAWTRGLFISQSGFTEDGLHAFGRGKRLICMDGLDLFETLNRGLHLSDVLLGKVRRAGETGAPFVRVRDLFPE